jgi:hypothetical protein
MGAFDKIVKLVSDTIKMEGKIIGLADQVKELSKEVRDIDKRLIRIETFAEIADKVKKLK